MFGHYCDDTTQARRNVKDHPKSVVHLCAAEIMKVCISVLLCCGCECHSVCVSEGFPSSKEDQNRASAVSLAPLKVNSSSAGVPRLISALPERRHTHVRLKQCPQNTKAPNTSLAMSQTRSSQKHPTAGAKQKKVNQRQITNGWRPVGDATDKEVFIAVS